MRTSLSARRSRAAWTSANVGAVSVAKLENSLHDLSNCGQRVQFSLLDLLEEAPQLRIVLDRALQVSLRPRGGDREHLPCEVVPAAILEQALRLEEGAVLL